MDKAAVQSRQSAQMMRQASQVDAIPNIPYTNAAQRGGASMVTAVEIGTGAGGLAKAAYVGGKWAIRNAPEMLANRSDDVAKVVDRQADEVGGSRRAEKPDAVADLIALVQARKKTAHDFYVNQGFAVHRIASHLDGIDFSKPVEVVTLRPPTTVVQYQVPGAAQGNYYSIPGTQPEKLGISARSQTKDGSIVQKQASTYVIQEDVAVLRSTAAKITDSWSIPGKEVLTTGGGTQFFSTRTGSFVKAQ